MSKRKNKTNIRLDLLSKCNKSYKKLQKAIKSGDNDKISTAKSLHQQNCAKLKTRK